jgi:hypothetical protein
LQVVCRTFHWEIPLLNSSVIRFGFTHILALVACLVLTVAASAQVLFSSGSSNNGSSIDSSGQDITDSVVTDSFTLQTTDTVTGAGIVIWTYNADPPFPAEELSTVNYQITSSFISTPISDPLSQGEAEVEDGNILNPAAQTYFQIEQDSFDIQPLTLDAGTYYFSLYDANTISTDPLNPEYGDPALWDDLPASVPNQPKAAVDGLPGTASTFSINGAPAITGTPEPSPLLTLAIAAIGLIVLATYRRLGRKFDR